MADLDVAQRLLLAARRDAIVLEKLIHDVEVDDSILGFHAQQAVEKSLKAVLSRAGVEFRRTHDLAELLDLMTDAGLAPPPNADRLDELNPFAVAARYGPLDLGPLDRPLAMSWVHDALVWASARLSRDSSI